MKRILVIAALVALLPALTPLRAQVDPQTAAAEREQAEERHRSTLARLERLEESIAAYQKTVTALRDEVRQLKDELDRLKNKHEGAATSDSIKRLAASIEAVDKQRAIDYQSHVKAFEELQKAILGRPSTGGRAASPAAGGTDTSKPPPSGNPGNAPKQPGWNYTIRANDTLGGIVQALKKQNINVSMTQIEKANEGVNWNRLRIGQTIFIPKP